MDGPRPGSLRRPGQLGTGFGSDSRVARAENLFPLDDRGSAGRDWRIPAMRSMPAGRLSPTLRRPAVPTGECQSAAVD